MKIEIENKTGRDLNAKWDENENMGILSIFFSREYKWYDVSLNSWLDGLMLRIFHDDLEAPPSIFLKPETPEEVETLKTIWDTRWQVKEDMMVIFLKESAMPTTM